MGAKKGKKGKGGDDEENPTENLLAQYKKCSKELETPTSSSFLNKLNDTIDEGEDLQEILINDKIGEFGARALSNALTRSTKGNKGFPTLKVLRIWEGDIGDEGVRALVQFIINTNNTSLSLMEFLNCNIGPLGCEFISRCFEPSLPCKIQYLTLDYNEFGNDGLKQLMNYIPCSSSLTYLSLAYCGIDEKGVEHLQKFLQTSATIEKLILMGNCLKDKGVKSLCCYLDSNKSLNELNINNVSFGEDADTIEKLIYLFKTNENIYIYQMKFNLISEANFKLIVKELKEATHIYQFFMDEEKYSKADFNDYFVTMKKRKPPKKKKKGKKKKK